jgi:DNA-binding transcriptional LysR family regulator
LQRTTRRLALTDAGQTYLLRVRNILQDIDEADAVARSHTTVVAGLLRLHAPPVLASYVIAPLLAEFRRQHPKILIDIEVETCKVPPIEDYDITLLGTDDSFDADVVARKVIESDAILVASPDYLKRRGKPEVPEDLAHHECLRLKWMGSRPRVWHMWHPEHPEQVVEVDVQPMLLANHTDTLLRATLDGAGITSVSVNLVAAHLTRGELVRVLSPWITGRLAMYAALPSRKFIPHRTRIFLDYLVAETQLQSTLAMQACTACG